MEFDEFEPGTVLGRYTLLAKIGHGGMADIYLARQAGPRGFERLCALKVMKELIAGADDHYDMFLDEARIAAQLSHPNIAQIFDFGEEQGRLYIAMEYLAGETLRAVIKKAGELPLNFAAQWISLAAGALDYAHCCKDVAGRSLNIVHRDISPENLFVTYQGALKVLDFGIAKASMRTTQTAAGLVKGKVAYMSPEQLQGRELDGRSDVFALGMVLYELLAGPPFDRKSAAPVEFLTGMRPLPSVREKNPAVPPGLEQIVSGALERDRDERIHSALELQRMLEAWLRENDAVSASSVSSWMEERFAQRVADRAALVQDALSGALAPAKPPGPSPSDARPRTEPVPVLVLNMSKPAAPKVEFGGAAAEARPITQKELLPDVPPAEQAPLPPVTVPGQPALEAPPATARPPENSLSGAIQRPRRPLFIGAAAVVLLLGGLGWLVLRGGGEPAPAPPAPVAAPVLAKWSVTTTPVGATIRVDGVDVGPAPRSLELAPGKHVIAATAPFFDTAQQDIEAKVGETRDLALMLAAHTQPDTVAVPTPAPTPAEPPEAAADDAPNAAPEPHANKPHAPRPPGKLTLDTVPWTSVFEGKKHLGDTPLFQVNLPSGSHELKLVNEQAHVHKTVRVVIKPGQVTAERLTLN